MATTSTKPHTARCNGITTSTSRACPTSTNSVATIFAWSGALRKRGELDGIGELVTFADRLEHATLSCIEDGQMTGDLARITSLPDPTVLSTEGFIEAVAARL